MAYSTCQRCGTPLSVEEVTAPQFGLASVPCPRCHAVRLLAPHELEEARRELLQQQRQARYRTLWRRVRRLLPI